MNRKKPGFALDDSKELQNLLSTTINSLSDWIHVIDADLTVLMMNDALKGMMKSLGYRENLEKKHLQEVFPFLSKKVINEYKKVFRTGKSLVTEEVNHFGRRKIYTETIKEPVFESNKVVRVITVIRDATNRKNAEEEIISSEKQLKIFAQRLQTIREEERVVISRELHDNLGQNLTALRFEISRLIKTLNNKSKKHDVKALAEDASGMINLVDASLSMARKLSRDLRPRILDELGLIPAIEWSLDEFMKRTGIICSFYSEVEKIEIHVRNKIAVFRIIQEVLTNIMRHSQATKVSASVTRKNQFIIIEVKDNGKGIGEHDLFNANSFGLSVMRERAILLGGILKIKGKKGVGTTVKLSIPVLH